MNKKQGKIKSPVLLIGGSSSLAMTRKMCGYAADSLRLRGDRPHAVVLPTASGDNPDIVDEIKGYLAETDCTYDFILLTRGDIHELEARLSRADLIYVSGGIEDRLREHWDKNGVTAMIEELARRGNLLLAGSSAGAMAFSYACPFVTPDGRDVIFKGLDLVHVWFTPHYQMDEYKGFDAGLAGKTEPVTAFAAGDDAGILCLPDGRFSTFFGAEGNSVWKYARTGEGWSRTEYKESPEDIYI